MIADGCAGGIFQPAAISVEQSPITADASFPLALPWLVIGLEQSDAEILLPRPLQNLGQEARLIDRGWQGTLAHASLARPAGLADQDLLARKGGDHLLPDGVDMRGRILGAGRNVLPIGQHVHGDEIDVAGHFPVAQPEFPDIGVGHRNVHARLHRADGVAKIRYDHVSPQQHLVADHDRRDRAGMILCERYCDVGEQRRSWRDRARSRPRAELSSPPSRRVRAPCPVRYPPNRCGRIGKPWRARRGPRRSARR